MTIYIDEATVIGYLIGCALAMLIIVLRYIKRNLSLAETMYSPILVLLSWIYVAIMIKLYYIERSKK